jgi:hypothetical protein
MTLPDSEFAHSGENVPRRFDFLFTLTLTIIHPNQLTLPASFILARIRSARPGSFRAKAKSSAF